MLPIIYSNVHFGQKKFQKCRILAKFMGTPLFKKKTVKYFWECHVLLHLLYFTNMLMSFHEKLPAPFKSKIKNTLQIYHNLTNFQWIMVKLWQSKFKVILQRFTNKVCFLISKKTWDTIYLFFKNFNFFEWFEH